MLFVPRRHDRRKQSEGIVGHKLSRDISNRLRAIMTHTRHVRDVINARPMKEGVGADVYRAVGSYHLPNLDPILLMDEFLVSKPGICAVVRSEKSVY